MATKTRPAPIIRLGPNDQAADGRRTIGQLIIEQVEAGVDLINAAGVAGITSNELAAWIREGTLVRARLNAGAMWAKEFTPVEQDQAIFAEAVVRARSTHIATLSILAEQLARGGLTKTSVRRRTQNGQVVEQVETVETLLPDADMVKWKLEKLEPQVYGSKATLNVNVQDLTDSDTVGETWDKRMREIAEALGAPAIEATGSET